MFERRRAAEQTDARLAMRAHLGDTDAFAELWSRHEPSARRAIGAAGARAADELPRVKAAVAGILRTHAYRDVAFRSHVLRAVDRTLAADDTSRRPSASLPILRAFTGLGTRTRALVWYLAAERLTPVDLVPLLGPSPRRLDRRARRARQRLFRRWLAEARARGLGSECYRVRRHDLLGGRAPLDDRLRAHAQTCPRCVVAAGAARSLLDHLGAVLVAADLGADAVAAYRGDDPSVASAPGDGGDPADVPVHDVRFSGLTGDDLPPRGLTHSALVVLDADGFEYTFEPVLVHEDRVRALIIELAEAAEQV